MAEEVPFGSGPSGQCGGGGGNGNICRSGSGYQNFDGNTGFNVPRQGNCGYCLMGDEVVTLANGTTKLAKEVEAGDELLGMNCALDIRPQIVTDADSFLSECVEVTHERGVCGASITHLFLDSELGAVPALQLSVGDTLMGDDGSPVSILEIRRIGEARVYRWTCTPDHTFMAGGLVHHNKVWRLPRDPYAANG